MVPFWDDTWRDALDAAITRLRSDFGDVVAQVARPEDATVLVMPYLATDHIEIETGTRLAIKLGMLAPPEKLVLVCCRKHTRRNPVGPDNVRDLLLVQSPFTTVDQIPWRITDAGVFSDDLYRLLSSDIRRSDLHARPQVALDSAIVPDSEAVYTKVEYL